MYTQDFFSHNIPMWNQILGPYKKTPIEFVEIGCFEGRATVWLCENLLLHPQSHITCVDSFSSNEELKDADFAKIKTNFLENTKPFANRVTLIEEKSVDFLKKYTKKATMIYIDGSHVAADVLQDAVLSDLILQPKGLLIFDDYLWYGLTKHPNVPRPAIDAFAECFSERYKLISSGYQLILEKQ